MALTWMLMVTLDSVHPLARAWLSPVPSSRSLTLEAQPRPNSSWPMIPCHSYFGQTTFFMHKVFIWRKPPSIRIRRECHLPQEVWQIVGFQAHKTSWYALLLYCRLHQPWWSHCKILPNEGNGCQFFDQTTTGCCLCQVPLSTDEPLILTYTSCCIARVCWRSLNFYVILPLLLYIFAPIYCAPP